MKEDNPVPEIVMGDYYICGTEVSFMILLTGLVGNCNSPYSILVCGVLVGVLLVPDECLINVEGKPSTVNR